MVVVVVEEGFGNVLSEVRLRSLAGSVGVVVPGCIRLFTLEPLDEYWES